MNKELDELKKLCKLVKVKNANKIECPVYVFDHDANSVDAFSLEWTKYPRVQDDELTNVPSSLRRLELLLGFPIDWLKDKTVVEVGAGPGRFTKLLAKHSKHVLAIDLSDAIFVNSALGMDNVTFFKGDFLKIDLPKIFDVIYCRGVLQHTPDPRESISKLISMGKVNDLIIFDIYKGYTSIKKLREWELFWRFILNLFVDAKQFEYFLQKKGKKLFKLHRFFNGLIRKNRIFNFIFKLTKPFYPDIDVDRNYPTFSEIDKFEVYKSLWIDTIFCKYDNRLLPLEVIKTLANEGQYPFSYDENRCIFRIKKTNKNKFNPIIGADGIFENPKNT